MPELKIAVESKQRAVTFCPVSALLDVPAEQARSMALVDESVDAPVPCQVAEADAGCRLHWVVPSLAAGQTAQYVLTDQRAPVAADPMVELTEADGDRIEVRIGGAHLTTYNYGAADARPSLYPAIGPFGAGLTRDFPFKEVDGDNKDHKHHRSLYWAWGEVNGSDNWSEEEGHGSIVHREFDSWGGGPVFGRISSRNDWVDHDGKKLMEDRVTLRFHNLPISMRVIDFAVALVASEGDVLLGDTKEGGICAVRVATTMNASGHGRIANSYGGTNEAETWGKRASWCDYSGPVDGHDVGIAVFDHPTNFRYPTYWHVRNYGLMTANPFGLSHFRAPEEVDGSHTIKAGEELAFRYRIYLHAGDAGEGDVKGKYLDWVCPPETTVAE